MIRRSSFLSVPIALLLFCLMITLVHPAAALAESRSDPGVPSALLSYCRGVQSNLVPPSTKEKAIFTYHKNSAVTWDADSSFQAGVTSSERLLQGLEGADAGNLRIVVSRVIGELCGFASEASEVSEVPG